MKIKRIVLLAVCGMLFGTVYIVGAVRSVNRIPELLKPNTYWVCEDYDAWFSVNGKGEIKGEVTIDGEERPFCIHYREGYSDLSGSPVWGCPCCTSVSYARVQSLDFAPVLC